MTFPVLAVEPVRRIDAISNKEQVGGMQASGPEQRAGPRAHYQTGHWGQEKCCLAGPQPMCLLAGNVGSSGRVECITMHVAGNVAHQSERGEGAPVNI